MSETTTQTLPKLKIVQKSGKFEGDPIIINNRENINMGNPKHMSKLTLYDTTHQLTFGDIKDINPSITSITQNNTPISLNQHAYIIDNNASASAEGLDKIKVLFPSGQLSDEDKVFYAEDLEKELLDSIYFTFQCKKKQEVVRLYTKKDGIETTKQAFFENTLKPYFEKINKNHSYKAGCLQSGANSYVFLLGGDSKYVLKIVSPNIKLSGETSDSYINIMNSNSNINDKITKLNTLYEKVRQEFSDIFVPIVHNLTTRGRLFNSQKYNNYYLVVMEKKTLLTDDYKGKEKSAKNEMVLKDTKTLIININTLHKDNYYHNDIKADNLYRNIVISNENSNKTSAEGSETQEGGATTVLLGDIDNMTVNTMASSIPSKFGVKFDNEEPDKGLYDKLGVILFFYENFECPESSTEAENYKLLKPFLEILGDNLKITQGVDKPNLKKTINTIYEFLQTVKLDDICETSRIVLVRKREGTPRKFKSQPEDKNTGKYQGIDERSTPSGNAGYMNVASAKNPPIATTLPKNTGYIKVADNKPAETDPKKTDPGSLTIEPSTRKPTNPAKGGFRLKKQQSPKKRVLSKYRTKKV